MPGEFRHKLFFYDGTGTAWAESHMHTGNLLSHPTTLSVPHASFELTTRVDPFGRVEEAIASDGGKMQTVYLGDQYQEVNIIDLGSGAKKSRTISRYDALGNLVKSWEAKNQDGIDADLENPTPPDPDNPGPFEDYSLNSTDKFVRSEYAYDVGKRLRRVEVIGYTGESTPDVIQERTFEYDLLGNLTREQYPELGGGFVRYSDFDSRATPRLVEYVRSGGTVDTALYTYYDAAGRPLTTWLRNTDQWFADNPDKWLQYSNNEWGTNTALNEVGKLSRSTQYNQMLPDAAACGTTWWQPESSIAVTSTYGYLGPLGMLSDRTTQVAFGCDGSDGSVKLNHGYGYDFWGNINTVRYPSIGTDENLYCSLPTPPAVGYHWDIVGGLSQIERDGIPLLSSVTYDAATGVMKGWQTRAGSSDWITHQLVVDGTRARPKRIKATGQSDVFDTGTFTYDVLGNITKLAGATGTAAWDYQYDPLSRLTKAISGADNQEYVYDDLGNITSFAGETLSVDTDTNRLNGTGFAYDRRGNLTEQPFGAWTRQLRYDPANRLMAAWATPDQLADGFFGFAYDSNGERVLKYRVQQTGDESTRQMTDATFFVRDETGSVLTEYQWTPGEEQLVSSSDHVYLGRNEVVTLEPVQTGSGWSWQYTTLVHDHLGTTRAEVYDGSSWNRIDYWPFGEIKGDPVATGTLETLENNRRYFAGHEREYVGMATGFSPIDGLDYMHARFYSADLGRFLGVDPVKNMQSNSQKFNQYSYAINNPIKIIDPDGRKNTYFTEYSIAFYEYFMGRELTSVENFKLFNLGMIPSVIIAPPKNPYHGTLYATVYWAAWMICSDPKLEFNDIGLKGDVITRIKNLNAEIWSIGYRIRQIEGPGIKHGTRVGEKRIERRKELRLEKDQLQKHLMAQIRLLTHLLLEEMKRGRDLGGSARDFAERAGYANNIR